MAKKKPKQIDWEAIEPEYRAGQKSLREIAREHGITDAAIRKKAAQLGWVRDLTKQVRERVRADLVREGVRTSNGREPEIVEAAAARGVEVVRSHRRDLSRLRSIAETLAIRLELYLGLLGQPMPDEDDEAAQEAHRAALLPLVRSFGEKESPADVLEKVARAMQRLVPLERQAFSLDDPGKDESATSLSPEQIRRMAQEVAAQGE